MPTTGTKSAGKLEEKEGKVHFEHSTGGDKYLVSNVLAASRA
jgi:hypothetical protein